MRRVARLILLPVHRPPVSLFHFSALARHQPGAWPAVRSRVVLRLIPGARPRAGAARDTPAPVRPAGILRRALPLRRPVSVPAATTATLSFHPFPRDASLDPYFLPVAPQSAYPSPTLSESDKFLPSLASPDSAYWGVGGGTSSGTPAHQQPPSRSPAAGAGASGPAIDSPPPSASYQTAAFPLASPESKHPVTPPASSDSKPFASSAPRDDYPSFSHPDSLTASSSSNLAARRQQASSQFNIATTRPFSLGSFPTPPPLSAGDMAAPLTAPISSANSSYVWTSSQPASPYYMTSASSNPPYATAGSQASSHGLGLRTYSVGQGFRSNSRPATPTAADILPSSSPYESHGGYHGGMSMPTGPASQTATSSTLPSLGTGSSMGSSYASAYSQSPISPQGYPPPSPSYQYTYGNSPMSPTTSGPSPMLSRSLTTGSYLPMQSPLGSYPRPGYLPGVGGSTYGSHLMGHPSMSPHHHHPGVHHPQQDRPFKCDQCPQSFSRNHDLKRHQRIHLAVKPFPCDNCEKSFSRKDALKRHRLVKGCGKGDRAQTASTSPTQANTRPSPATELK